jgi:5'-3' exonuclease
LGLTMGVPLFFRRIVQEYFQNAVSAAKPRCTTLALDFAGITHQLYEKMNTEYDGWSLEFFMQKLFGEITKLTNDVNVQKRLIISMDGMAPLGKMNQQRKRRFRHTMEAEPNNAPFDSNAFSPGTDVSIAMDNMLTTFIQKNRHKLPREIIYSGYQAIGEGEHKIIAFLQDLFDEEKNKARVIRLMKLRHPKFEIDPGLKLDRILALIEEKFSYQEFQIMADEANVNESILIHGLDADLIFLTLPLESNIFLWRQNVFVPENKLNQLAQKYPHLPINELKKRARVETHTFLSIQELKKQLAIYQIGVPEFILGGFIFGNDFVPFQAGFNLTSEVATSFIENLKGRKFADPFNLAEFQQFLKDFIVVQESLLPKLLGQSPIDISSNRDKNATEIIKFPMKLVEENDFSKFRTAWNDRLTFNDKLVMTEEESTGELKIHSINYLKTIIWCMQYYKNHLNVNWEWVYYPYWAPLLQDIVKIKDFDFSDVVQRRPLRINIIAQMALILPRERSGEPNLLLPRNYRIVQTPESPIFDFYPRTATLIRDGVMQKSDGFVYLPSFDYLRLADFFDNLPLSESSRNKYTPNHEVYKDVIEVYFPEEEEVVPDISRLTIIEDPQGLWGLRATWLYGEGLANEFIPKMKQHFFEPSMYNGSFSGFREQKIIVQTPARSATSNVK